MSSAQNVFVNNNGMTPRLDRQCTCEIDNIESIKDDWPQDDTMSMIDIVSSCSQLSLIPSFLSFFIFGLNFCSNSALYFGCIRTFG